MGMPMEYWLTSYSNFDMQFSVCTSQPSFTQADVDAAFADGAASVDITSDNQAVADQFFNWGFNDGFGEGAASVTPEDGITQSDVDAAYEQGVASVTPEDGIGQADVDAAYEAGVQYGQIDGHSMGYASGYDEGAASVTPEDGIDQADVDAAYAAGVASVEVAECEEVATQNMPLDLPQGWSMFGYTCLESLDVVEAFSDISDNIEIVKDEWGLAYLPAWGFSAFDNLEFGEGYQIKMIEEVADFQFCTTIAGGASQDELDAAIAEVHAMYEGWCESDLDNDGICDVDEVSGCMDASSCNYVSEAEFDDGSCDYESCLDECGVINGDNSTCSDCAGIPNGTSEDLGCGCGNPVAEEGYDCDGNEIIELGDIHEGGIIFYIDETGQHGLVAAMEDLTEGATNPYGLGGYNGYEWGCFDENVSGANQQSIGTGYQNTLNIVNSGCVTDNGGITAAQAAFDAEINGYSDWYLPSIDELLEMFYTIGNGSPEGNLGGFDTSVFPFYWSSSEGNYHNINAAYVLFDDGGWDYNRRDYAYRVRVIRAF